MEKTYPRGSQWSKWDLHVHTPDSLVNYYSGTNEQAWEQFINELEALPPEFKVLGINDYWFLDGYRKVCTAKRNGRLSNIDLILPIIELRIDKFGGTESKLNRVNFHAIFSDKIDVDVIQQQFLNALTSKYKLNDKYASLQRNWSGVITKESLTDLGKSIIDSVPSNKRNREPNAPLIEGFNNLNVNLDTVLEILSGHYFKDQYLTAVGKTEWYDIKWSEQSIADKRTIINNVDWVFTSSSSVDDWLRAKNNLSENQVNNRLLDCSDAHYFSNSIEKDRIGNCFTWIKADPTFSGFQMALFESNERIFIGEKPEKTKHVETNPTKYIQKLGVNKKQNSALTEEWFDQTSIEFNSDLVAIIGNKGSGKSALTDILGLIGNTPNSSKFSFLNQKRFRKQPHEKSQHFEAVLTWESGTMDKADLSSLVDDTAAETIKYIPQGLFDEICSEVPGGEKGKFDEEIERVIFSRLPTAERLSKSKLSDLIDFKTQETYEAISLLKTDIEAINRVIIQLENEASTDYQKRITSQYDLKKRELNAHEAKKPTPINPPSQNGQDTNLVKDISAGETKQIELHQKIQTFVTTENEVKLQLALIGKLGQRIENLNQIVNRFFNDSKEDEQTLGLALSNLVSFNINLNQLNLKRQELEDQEISISNELDTSNSKGLMASLRETETNLVELRSKLDEPNRVFQQYQQAYQEWDDARKEIIGSTDQSDSLAYFEAKLETIKTIEPRLKENREERLKITKKIYQQIKLLAEENRKLYRPVQEFIDASPIAKGKLSLNFDVSIVDIELASRFFDWISRSSAGSFRGADEGAKMLQNIIAQHNFDTDEDIELFLDELMARLLSNKREGLDHSLHIQSQMRDRKSVESFYDYIFTLDYLRPRYILKMVDKELSQLSPGEKGALLLVFYLLVDKSDVPMVIDQPEENLDNQTVFELLVDAIKDAKKRRQIILVTHNPNLAVVCDAEQVICSTIDKANNNKVTYITGSIENPSINTRIVNILEGTKPAFDNRKLKYHA